MSDKINTQPMTWDSKLVKWIPDENGGIPAFLILTDEERRQAWRDNPPKAYYPKDQRVEQDRLLRAEQKKEQTQKRIDALRKSKGLPLIYNSTISSTQTQENLMPKYVIKPLDKHGHPVMRAVTSIADDAADEQINEKVLSAVKRGGSKVVNVVCVNTLSEVVLAWAVTAGEIAPCDVEPFKTAPQPVADADAAPAEANAETEAVTEESDMAKKKVKKASSKKPRVKKEGVRAGSKTEIVKKLLTRETGCTAKQVLEATGWPAVSMPAMAKACGLKLRKDKVKGEKTRYFGS